jgi:type IV secretory pathway TrbF-like protein
MERYEVAAFIRDAHSVTSDPQVEHQMLNALLAHTRGDRIDLNGNRLLLGNLERVMGEVVGVIVPV